MCAADASEQQVLFAFDRSGAWSVVNDTVMGGRSASAVNIDDGMLRFRGQLSLENNGGFASIQNAVELNLRNRDGIRLRVRGDGRDYQLRLQTDARYFGRPVAFSATFPTTAGKWTEVDVPFEQFKAGFRGRRLDGYELDTSRIERVGILLGDKQPGAFELDVDWLAAY